MQNLAASIVLFNALNTLKNLRVKLPNNPTVDKSLAGTMVVVGEQLLNQLRTEAGIINPDLAVDYTEQDMIRSGVHGKIPAIKHYRERTGAGLAEAKQAIEKWGRDNRYYNESNQWTGY